MALVQAVVLPAQPATGLTTFVPLSGDGRIGPLGYYLAQNDIVGDVSGGNTTLTISGDPRYTNWIAWVNAKVHSAAAAPEFLMSLRVNTTNVLNQLQVTGTMQHNTVSQPTSSYLWTPPPILWETAGAISLVTPNVDATETYSLLTQVFCFDKNVTHQTIYAAIALGFNGVQNPPSA